MSAVAPMTGPPPRTASSPGLSKPTLFGGNAMVGSTGAAPRLFAGEPIAMDSRPRSRWPPTPAFARSRSPIAGRPGAMSPVVVTPIVGMTPPAPLLASPQLTHRSSVSPAPQRLSARGAVTPQPPFHLQMATPPQVPQVVISSPATTRRGDRGEIAVPVSARGPSVDSRSNSAVRSASYENLPPRRELSSNGGGGTPHSAAGVSSACGSSPQALQKRPVNSMSVPNMPTAEIGPGGVLPVGPVVPVAAVPVSPMPARQQGTTPRGNQQTTPRGGQHQGAPKGQQPRPPAPVPTPTNPPPQAPVPAATAQAACAALAQIMPDMPLPSQQTLAADGGMAITQLLQEVLQEVRNIKKVEPQKTKDASPSPVNSGSTQAVSTSEGEADPAIELMRKRCAELEKNEQCWKDQIQDAHEKLRECHDRKECLEAQVKEQEQEISGSAKRSLEQVKRLEESKKAVEEELDSARAQLERAGKQACQFQGDLDIQLQRLKKQKAEAEAETSKSEQRERELKLRLQEATEAARHLDDEKRSLRADLDRALEELEQARVAERAGEELSAHTAARIEELEKSERDLLAQVRALSGSKNGLLTQYEEREQELSSRLNEAVERASNIVEEKAALESEVSQAQRARGLAERSQRQAEEAVEAAQTEARQLYDHVVRLEAQVRQMEEERPMQQHQQQQPQGHQVSPQDQAHQQQKSGEESAQSVQWYKQVTWELENQIRRQHDAVTCAPGDYLRLMKAHEGESLCFENGMLKKALTTAQLDVEVCQRTIEEQAAVIKELQKGASTR